MNRHQSQLAVIVTSLLALLIPAHALADDEVIHRIATQLGVSVMEIKSELQTGCDSGDSYRMKRCALFQFMIADTKLNDAYAKLQKQLTTPSARSKLRIAQRAWISFRDAACNYESDAWSGGRDQEIMILGCEAEYTEKRLTQLEGYLDCTAPGCPGEW